MKLFNAVVLGLVIGTLQSRPSVSSARGIIRISDYFADHSHPGSVTSTTNDVAAGAADRLPPPVPARPALSPPGEPYLPLYASASDEVWDKVKCKGTNFVRAMRGSDKEAGSVFSPPRESAAGEFEDISDLEEWGWDIMESGVVGDLETWGVDGALEDLGISDKCVDKGGSVHCLTFVHGRPGFDDNNNWVPIDQKTYEANGKTYRATGAHYGFGLEPNKGVIIAMDRESPQSAGKDHKPVVAGDELPAIRAFSDVAWLTWKNFGADIKNLNYFMSLSINNLETTAVVSRAIREILPEAQGFPAWGGYEFDTDTPEGQAILGTPNAQAFSYLLLQHKAALGDLYISQVRVFRDSRQKPGLCLLLVVEPVPAVSNTNELGKQHSEKEIGKMNRHLHRLALHAKL